MIQVPENRRIVIAVVCLVAIVASGMLIVRSWRGDRPTEKAYADYFGNVGRMAARETVRLLDGKGKVGVLYMQLSKEGDDNAAKQVDAFAKELAERGGVTLAVKQGLSLGADVTDPTALLSARRFAEFVQKNPGLDLIVSFAGAPAISAADAARLQPKPRVLVAKLTKPVSGEQVLASGVVVAAFVPRADAKVGRSGLSSLEDWFKKNFDVLPSPGAPKAR